MRALSHNIVSHGWPSFFPDGRQVAPQPRYTLRLFLRYALSGFSSTGSAARVVNCHGAGCGVDRPSKRAVRGECLQPQQRSPTQWVRQSKPMTSATRYSMQFGSTIVTGGTIRIRRREYRLQQVALLREVLDRSRLDAGLQARFGRRDLGGVLVLRHLVCRTNPER